MQQGLAPLNKEIIMAEVTDQEPVLELNGKKYIISELEPQAQYCVGQMQFIQGNIDKAQQELDRQNMAYSGFNNQLVSILQPVNTEEPPSEEEVN